MSENKQASMGYLLVITIICEIILILVATGVFVHDLVSAINYLINKDTYIIFSVIGGIAIFAEVIYMSSLSATKEPISAPSGPNEVCCKQCGKANIDPSKFCKYCGKLF